MNFEIYIERWYLWTLRRNPRVINDWTLNYARTKFKKISNFQSLQRVVPGQHWLTVIDRSLAYVWRAKIRYWPLDGEHKHGGNVTRYAKEERTDEWREYLDLVLYVIVITEEALEKICRINQFGIWLWGETSGLWSVHGVSHWWKFMFWRILHQQYFIHMQWKVEFLKFCVRT